MATRRYVICDIEATGLHAEKDLIEIALITYQDGKVTEIFETLINPEIALSPFIREFTGISQKEIDQAPKFHEVADSIRLRIENSIFVSHNNEFDLGLLKKKFDERGEFIKTKGICTLKMSEDLIPGLQSYNLDAMSAFFRIKNTKRHRALGDALATLELFKELQGLQSNTTTTAVWLPQHEKLFKDLSLRAGLLRVLDHEGNVLKSIATPNAIKCAREILEIKPSHRELLLKAVSLDFLPTGSALIAELEKLKSDQIKFHWIIKLEKKSNGEIHFGVHPHRRGESGIWYFTHRQEALKKCESLNRKLSEQRYVHHEGGRSKEEILRRNLKATEMAQAESFPAPHLIIIGQGRTLLEKSLTLVRDNHVIGYGHTQAPEEDILSNPDAYLTQRYRKSPVVDLATRRYLRELKNQRQKTESWRSISSKSMLEQRSL